MDTFQILIISGLVLGGYKIISSNDRIRSNLKLFNNFIKYKVQSSVLDYLQLIPESTETSINVKYYVNDNLYIIALPKPQRGPKSIVNIFDKENNVTENLRCKLGPHGNFHSVSTTPKMLGYSDGLSLQYRNKDGLYFYGGTEIIKLNV